MIKGCQKKIIQIKDTKSPFFEEAYFVLKNDAEASSNEKLDIISEATSIVNRYSPSTVTKNNRGKFLFRFLFFIGGVLIGACIMAVISFLLQ